MRGRQRNAIAVAVTGAAVVCVVATPAWAQRHRGGSTGGGGSSAPQPAAGAGAGAGSPENDLDRQAREHFERGLALVQQARWADAVAELEQARAARAVPAVLFNLGIAHRALNHNRAAIEAFRAYITATSAGGGANDRRAEAEGYIHELEGSLGHLALDVLPAGATVMLDGTAVPSGERALEVDPGQHVVTVSAPRYRSHQETVRVGPGGAAALTVRLETADVVVNGPPVPALALLGVGVVGFGAAIVFGVLRANAMSAFENDVCNGRGTDGVVHCPPGSDGDPNYRNAVSYTYATDVALGVGAAAVLAGGAWLIFGWDRNGAAAEQPPRAWLNAAPTPGGVVVGAGGTF